MNELQVVVMVEILPFFLLLLHILRLIANDLGVDRRLVARGGGGMVVVALAGDRRQAIGAKSSGGRRRRIIRVVLDTQQKSKPLQQ